MTLIPADRWRPQGGIELESNAWDALRETTRSVCVTAGAGAGKTEFLAQKATYLLQTGICQNPKRILAISFKRDAARNLAERVERRCPPDQARRFYSVTFDAFTKSLVDRFRVAIPEPYAPPRDYRIDFPKTREVEDFLRRNGFNGVTAAALGRSVANSRLPLQSPSGSAVRAYWDAQYREYNDVFLTFPMINRLAEWLLRENAEIRRALQATYPFVFLDEFQDTTDPQFECIKTAFDRSNTIFTAVGDDKQRIMGWAGAMGNAFNQFETSFTARRIPLLSNWRSHRDLVQIQHAIARRIDPSSAEPEARAERTVDGDIAAIWQFDSEAGETQSIAAWIADEIRRGIPAHEFAILVRQNPDKVEERLASTLAEQNVRLRNVARSVGEISIQDLLSEELAEVLLPLLRLGASRRNPAAWSLAQRSMQYVAGIYPEDDSGQMRLQRRLETFVRALRSEMQALEPDSNTARRLARLVLDFVDPIALRGAVAAYQRQDDFERVWEGFRVLFAESAEGSDSWTDALDQFEGLGQVAMMTIHKSKGLEFHTMIFYGLDKHTWWSLTPTNAEELSSFFVAFTRAKQRAFFTLCTGRGAPVTWIENLLLPVGLRRTRGPTS